MSNFSDYIDRKQFEAKPHSSQPVTFGFQNAKPFQRISSSVPVFDSINNYNHSAPIVSQKPFTYASTLGNPAPRSSYKFDEPFGFLTNSFPSFDRSWQPKYVEHAYTKNITGKSQEQIKHDLKLSHARQPANGGQPRKDPTPLEDQQEWARELLDGLVVNSLETPLQRKMETIKRERARNLKFPKPMATTPILVQPASSVLASSVSSSSAGGGAVSSSQKNASGAIVTPKTTNNQVNTVASTPTSGASTSVASTPVAYWTTMGKGAIEEDEEEDNNSLFPQKLFTDPKDHDSTVFAFKSNNTLDKEIRALENKEKTLQIKVTKLKSNETDEAVIAKQQEKLTLLREEIVAKRAVLTEKKVEKEKHDDLEQQKQYERLSAEDQKFFTKSQKLVEGLDKVPAEIVNITNIELMEKGHRKIHGGITKPESFTSALWASIGHASGIKVKTPVKKVSAEEDNEEVIPEVLSKPTYDTGTVLNDKRRYQQFK